MSEVEVLRQQVAELLPWALMGALAASWFDSGVVGGDVNRVRITRYDAAYMKERIESGEFGKI